MIFVLYRTVSLSASGLLIKTQTFDVSLQNRHCTDVTKSKHLPLFGVKPITTSTIAIKNIHSAMPRLTNAQHVAYLDPENLHIQNRCLLIQLLSDTNNNTSPSPNDRCYLWTNWTNKQAKIQSNSFLTVEAYDYDTNETPSSQSISNSLGPLLHHPPSLQTPWPPSSPSRGPPAPLPPSIARKPTPLSPFPTPTYGSMIHKH